PVADLDVAAEHRAVGEHGVAAHHAVMGHVRAGHQQVVVADTRDPLVVSRAAVDGAELAEHVALADHEPRGLAAVFLVLRRIADGSELEHVVAGPDDGRPVDHCGGAADGTRADLHARPYHRERADRDVASEARLGRHHGTRVDHPPDSGATIMSACATSLSPTSATVENFQMPRSERSSCAVSTS